MKLMRHLKTLDYDGRRLRTPFPHWGAVSVAFGIAVVVLNAFAMSAPYAYELGPRGRAMGDWVERFAYDYHLILLLPLVAIIGIIAGVVSWKRNPDFSSASAAGILFSGLALAMSLIECFLYIVFSGMNH